MTEEQFRDRLARLTTLSDAVKDLDPSVRSIAVELLRDFVYTSPGSGGPVRQQQGQNDVPVDRLDFFARWTHDKPADNAKLIAAYLYSKYGVAPFSVKEIELFATEVGLTVPSRLDMTFLDSQADGKALFTRAGRGQFRPTVTGELYFKETYKVSKGTAAKPSADTPE